MGKSYIHIIITDSFDCMCIQNKTVNLSKSLFEEGNANCIQFFVQVNSVQEK